MSEVRDFKADLAATHTPEAVEMARRAILKAIPRSLNANPSHFLNDLLGLDFVVELEGAETTNADIKYRDKDYSVNGIQDVVLEIWSNWEERKAGWTCDDNKKTKHIIWIFKDTGRFLAYDFNDLRAAFKANLLDWKKRFKTDKQINKKKGGGTYTSQSITVPCDELDAAIKRLKTGYLN